MTTAIDRLARTLLYEGFMLYPYRADSTKNRQRFQFGTLHPRAWCERESSDTCALRAEVLVRGANPRVTVRIRFLDNGIEREFTGAGIHHAGEVAVAIDVHRERALPDITRLTVHVANETSIPDDRASDLRVRRASIEVACLASTHVLFAVDGGAFVSLLEPPPELAELASTCRNEGVWPVLVGSAGSTDAMLASPIILYDYPAIAPESAGELFDATEIDEILTLRVLTLSDAEKAQIRASDPRARAILERCERMSPDELAALHGRTTRGAFAVGDRVRVQPAPPTGSNRSDAIDSLLAGKLATIVRVEQELEGRMQYAVAFDDDPGRENLIAHRFFFREAELEKLA